MHVSSACIGSKLLLSLHLDLRRCFSACRVKRRCLSACRGTCQHGMGIKNGVQDGMGVCTQKKRFYNTIAQKQRCYNTIRPMLNQFGMISHTARTSWHRTSKARARPSRGPRLSSHLSADLLISLTPMTPVESGAAADGVWRMESGAKPMKQMLPSPQPLMLLSSMPPRAAQSSPSPVPLMLFSSMPPGLLLAVQSSPEQPRASLSPLRLTGLLTLRKIPGEPGKAGHPRHRQRGVSPRA